MRPLRTAFLFAIFSAMLTTMHDAVAEGDLEVPSWYNFLRPENPFRNPPQDPGPASGKLIRPINPYSQFNPFSKDADRDKAFLEIADPVRAARERAIQLLMEARSYARVNDYDSAISLCDHAILTSPTYFRCYMVSGTIRMEKNDYQKAIHDFNTAILLSPEDARIFILRGYSWLKQKNVENALRDYEKAVALLDRAPKSNAAQVAAFNQYAWLLATCPVDRYRHGEHAVASANRACELTGWKDAIPLGTLAAAYAEFGDFEKAVEWQGKANAFYTNDPDKKRGEERLSLYKEKQPYREEY